ncbi:MAG: hypothetical protein U5J64_01315 [Halobacteriales archaeon]|nr:hypothetical protein [Halobacteriales archaeon]
MEDRAQVNTLEGFAAAFVIIFAVFFGLQAVASTSPGTLSQEVQTYDQKITNDVLVQSKVVEAGETQSELKTALLNWTTSGDGFNGSADGEVYYDGSSPVPGGFGETLNILEERDIAYSIDLVCDGKRQPFVRQGDGGENPVSSSVTVILNDDDRLEDGTRLENAPGYPCKDVGEDSNLYNVVEVRITAWRT